MDNASSTGDEAKIMSYDDKPLEAARLVIDYSIPNGYSHVGTDYTDGSGYYLFPNLLPDCYELEFELLSGYAFSLKDQGGNDATDSDINTATGRTTCFMLNEAEDDMTWDAGMYEPALASIGNFVWSDADNDGIQDGGENGIENVTVNLYKRTYEDPPQIFEKQILTSRDDVEEVGPDGSFTGPGYMYFNSSDLEIVRISNQLPPEHKLLD